MSERRRHVEIVPPDEIRAQLREAEERFIDTAVTEEGLYPKMSMADIKDSYPNSYVSILPTDVDESCEISEGRVAVATFNPSQYRIWVRELRSEHPDFGFFNTWTHDVAPEPVELEAYIMTSLTRGVFARGMAEASTQRT